MCLATAVHSLPPLFVDLTNGSQYPFLFNTIWRLTAAAGVVVYLFARHRNIIGPIKNYLKNYLFSKESRVEGDSLPQWANFLWGLTFVFDYALFAWSTQFIETTVAASLIALWVIFYVIIRQRQDKKLSEDKQQYKDVIKGEQYTLMCFAAIGFFFVIISESGQFDLGANSFHLLIGSSLALLSAFARANMARQYTWADNLSKELLEDTELKNTLKGDKDEPSKEEKDNLRVVTQLIAFVISVSLIIPINLAIGLGTENISNVSLTAWLFMILGGAITTFAPIAFRKASVLTENLGVMVIQYFQPILSLALIALFPALAWLPIVETNLARIDYFVLGTAAIVAISILINCKVERNAKFPWLVISLWICGLIVLLRDTYLKSSRLGDQWLWDLNNGEYYAIVALSAMIFILILEFHTSRLAERITNEEHLAISLYKINKDKEFRKSIKEIDKELDVEKVIEAYERASAILEAPIENLNNFEQNRVQGELDMLVHSKTKGRDFSERIVLVFFGIITIIITLSTRPAVMVNGTPNLTGFLIDLFAILFSSAIVFMTITLFDLRRERRESTFSYLEDSERDSKLTLNLRWGIGLSIGLSIAMIGVFAFLLWVKWIGIWCLSTPIGWGACPL